MNTASYITSSQSADGITTRTEIRMMRSGRGHEEPLTLEHVRGGGAATQSRITTATTAAITNRGGARNVVHITDGEADMAQAPAVVLPQPEPRFVVPATRQAYLRPLSIAAAPLASVQQTYARPLGMAAASFAAAQRLQPPQYPVVEEPCTPPAAPPPRVEWLDDDGDAVPPKQPTNGSGSGTLAKWLLACLIAAALLILRYGRRA